MQRLRNEGIFRLLNLVGVRLYGRGLKGEKQAFARFLLKIRTACTRVKSFTFLFLGLKILAVDRVYQHSELSGEAQKKLNKGISLKNGGRK